VAAGGGSQPLKIYPLEFKLISCNDPIAVGIKDVDLEGTRVPIRYDPFNVGIAYGYVPPSLTQGRVT
jgi:hypothetical protein